jgi:hypothetical protein
MSVGLMIAACAVAAACEGDSPIIWCRAEQARDGDRPQCTIKVMTDPPPDEFDPDGEPIAIPITDVIDLHTVPPRDVKGVVEAWLDEVHARGFTAIRIIHGRGVGVQRDIVRRVLSRTPYVRSYGDAPAEAGGWGATIATLDPRQSPRFEEFHTAE